MIRWNLESDSGNSGAVSNQEIMQQLQGMGEQPVGISADGAMVTLQDGQGTFEVKTQDLLQNMGWKVTGVTPENANTDFAKPEWRAAVSMLPHDSIRQAYLQEQMQNLGQKDIKIVGAGDDWYAFNPQDGKYYGMTNKQGADLTDVAGAAMQAPAFIGGIAGGAGGAALGSAAGPAGTVAGGAAGAGAGSAAGGTLARTGLAAYDPTYRRLASENLGAVGGDIAKTAGIDALTGGAGAALPFAAKGLAPIMRSGPLSSAARVSGALAEEGGKLGQMGFRALNKPLGREIGAGFVPGLSELDAAGWLAQTPAMAGRGIESMAPKIGEKLGEAGGYLGGRGGKEAIRNRILKNYDMIRYGDVSPSMMGPRQQMMDPLEAIQWARGMEQPNVLRQSNWRQAGQGFGQKLGEYAGNFARHPAVAGLEQAGQAAGKFATGGAGAIARAGELGSGALRYGGAAARKAGALAAPHEMRAYGQLGAEEAAQPYWDDYWNRQNTVVPSRSTLT